MSETFVSIKNEEISVSILLSTALATTTLFQLKELWNKMEEMWMNLPNWIYL